MKIFIGNIVGRTEEVGFSQSMRELVLELTKRGIEFTDGTIVGDALVSRARSMVASQFLRSDADVMMSIDSDIWFRPEDVIALCEKAMTNDCIGAMYLTRALKTQPALLLPPDKEIIFMPGVEPEAVRFISTGFMAIHRRVFERLAKDLPLCHKGGDFKGTDTSFYPFYMPFIIPELDGEEGHLYLSEDWAFCERARDAGFKIMLDPSIRLGHIGSHMYILEDLAQTTRPPAQPLTLKRAANGQLTTGLLAQGSNPALSSLPEDVHAYFNLNGNLKEELNEGGVELEKLWQEKPQSQSEWDFYKRADVGKAYTLDLADWHLTGLIAGKMIKNFRGIQGEQILDYGSGIGTMALMLAGQRNHVHCLEPNKVMREFTEYRAKKLECRVRWKQYHDDLHDYDTAICFHVLEHVSDPIKIAQKVVAALKPGGRLFTESDFTDGGDHPMHHLNSDDPRGEKIWEGLGMVRENNEWWTKPEKILTGGREND